MEIGNRNPFVMQQFAARDAVRQKNGRQAEEFDTFLKSVEENDTQQKKGAADTPEAKTEQETDYRKFLLEKMEEMRVNIKNGTIQPKFQIGAEAYTHEEWKKLLEKVDAAEDTIREQIEAEIEAAKEEAQEDGETSDTRIITRADGARILMIKTPFGEMSVELSKPEDSVALSNPEDSVELSEPEDSVALGNLAEGDFS